jgi:hypothetical protein
MVRCRSGATGDSSVPVTSSVTSSVDTGRKRGGGGGCWFQQLVVPCSRLQCVAGMCMVALATFYVQPTVSRTSQTQTRLPTKARLPRTEKTRPSSMPGTVHRSTVRPWLEHNRRRHQRVVAEFMVRSTVSVTTCFTVAMVRARGTREEQCTVEPGIRTMHSGARHKNNAQ